MKPIFKLFLIVFLSQLVVYGFIFYFFESISTTGYPTKFRVLIIPAIFSTFFAIWMISSFKKRIRKRGVTSYDFKNYLNLAEFVFEPQYTPKELIEKLKKDELLSKFKIDSEGNIVKIHIPYSIFLKEIIHIDFDTNTMRIIAKPRFLVIYAPFGGSLQKFGYLECVLEDKQFELK